MHRWPTRTAIARFLLGDDVFISYARSDGATYALALANELIRQGLSCFLDQWGTRPGADLPRGLRRAIDRSTLFVLVGTPAAVSSPAVAAEVTQFLATGRSLLPVSVDGALERAPWFEDVRGLAITPETTAAVIASQPSSAVIARIVNAQGFVRRSARLRRIFWWTAAAIALLVSAGGAATFFFALQADAQRRLADARELANRAESARGRTAESLIRSTLLALRSIERGVTVEGDQALRRDIVLLPRLLSSDTLAGAVRALAPGGRIAAIETADGQLELHDLDRDSVIASVPWRGGILALSADGHLATSRGASVTIQAPDGASHPMEIPAADEESGVKTIALDPRGRYVAWATHWSEAEEYDDGPVVRDLGGDSVLLAGDREAHINGIAFSADGEFLVAAGTSRSDAPDRGYARTWWLDANRTQPRLVELERLNQPDSVAAVAVMSGAGEVAVLDDGTVRVWRSLAGGDGLSRRLQLGREGYAEVARIPVDPAMVVTSLAFTADRNVLLVGTSRGVVERWEPFGVRDYSTLEVYGPVVFLSFAERDRLRLSFSESFTDVPLATTNLDAMPEPTDPELAGGTLSLSGDGSTVARVIEDSIIEMFRFGIDTPFAVIRPGSIDEESVTLSRDGRFLAVIGPSPAPTAGGVPSPMHPVSLFTTDAPGRSIGRIETEEWPAGIEIPPDGRRLLVCCTRGGGITVWSMPAGRRITPPALAGLSGASFIRLSSTGRWLVTNGRSRVSPGSTADVQVRDGRTGTFVFALDEIGTPTAIAFGPGERLLALADSSGLLQVWDTGLRRPVLEMRMEANARVSALAISPDERLLAVAVSIRRFDDATHAIRSYFLHASELARQACSRLQSAARNATAACREDDELHP